MANHNEIQEWIQSLSDEVDDMGTLIDRIEDNKEFTKDISKRLINVIKSLIKAVTSLIHKYQSLDNYDLQSEARMGKLRNEYYRTMENIDSLYNTVNPFNLKPHYIVSTYTSRKRLNSNSKPPRSTVHTKTRSLTPDHEEKDLKSSLFNLNLSYKSHKHKNYELQITKLQEENIQLLKKSLFLKEETQENFKQIKDLISRIEKLEY
jgi:hypothetical protein